MKNLGVITDPKDIITKEFLEEGIGARVNTLEDNLQMAESDIETLQGDVQSLQTDNTATKAAVQTLQNTYVPNTRKVNGKALDADITLTAQNVGTQPATWTKINNEDNVESLVISGSQLGGEVELGFLNSDDGFYYGDYKRNAYISALYNGRVEVSVAPTTDMGIANKGYVDGLAIYTTLYHIISTTAWVTNTNSQASTQEKTDFPFMTTISLVNITTDYCVDVLFSYDDQISGNFCPCVYSVAGGVIIEAKEKPSAVITIPVIRYWKPIVQQPSSGSNTP